VLTCVSTLIAANKLCISIKFGSGPAAVQQVQLSQLEVLLLVQLVAQGA